MIYTAVVLYSNAATCGAIVNVYIVFDDIRHSSVTVNVCRVSAHE